MINTITIEDLAKQAYETLDQITALFVQDELENIKQDMKKKNLPVPKNLMADGISHCHEGLVNGELKKIRYIVCIDTLELDTPLVSASYYVLDKAEQYSYSSLKNNL